MKTFRGRLCAAGLTAVAAIALFPSAALAEFCQPVSREPITVGVGGNPVVSTPALTVYVCYSADGPGFLDIVDDVVPRAEVVQYSGGVGVIVEFRASVSVDYVKVGYSVGGSGSETVVPIGVGVNSGQEMCVVYAGEARSNPGGCEVFIEF